MIDQAAYSVFRRVVKDAVPSETFVEIYKQWFTEVTRWVAAFGVPRSESEDVAQEVFELVRRKLPEFDGRNVCGWLYRIARRAASDHRRGGWFRKIFHRPGDFDVERIADLRGTPLAQLESKEAEQLVRALASKLSPKKRAAFILFELEGYTGEEIATLENTKVATIFTRLHHAQKEFAELLARFKRAEKI